ncbi:MAG TPA: hypothetical protein DCM05_10220 [Elusimicrobia bacterium]|nr:hypothetical protein [Elusimicrobiota bacterium]
MRWLRAALVVALLGFLAWLALRKQLAYAKLVSRISRTEEFLVPIEAGSLLALSSAAASGLPAAGLKPVFVYAQASFEGRTLTVRPAYTEKQAPEGPMMTMKPMGFLLSAAADPKAEGVAINPGAAAAPFSSTLDAAATRRVIGSLQRRGFGEKD